MPLDLSGLNAADYGPEQANAENGQQPPLDTSIWSTMPAIQQPLAPPNGQPKSGGITKGTFEVPKWMVYVGLGLGAYLTYRVMSPTSATPNASSSPALPPGVKRKKYKRRSRTI